MTLTVMGRLVSTLLVCLLALGVSGCGSDENDKEESRSSGEARQVRAVEEAFLTGMVHHHDAAIEMAEIAKEKGEARFITELADAIATTQEQEIARMEAIYRRLHGGELKPNAGAHEALGLTAEEAGMTHDAHASRALRTAEPFDRAFVDEMVPHHEGAIRMANVVLKATRDGELRRLAESIVSTQEHEIEQMNSFRSKRFGGRVPGDAGHEDHATEERKRD